MLDKIKLLIKTHKYQLLTITIILLATTVTLLGGIPIDDPVG
ncbi:MAG: hypothetical protein ACP5IZ_09450 [Thermoprotei archaeon]